MRIKFMVVLAGVAWQCCAIQINVDTVFTSAFSGTVPGTQFIIRNTSAIDTAFIDSIYMITKYASSITFGTAMHPYMYEFMPSTFINDSFSIATNEFKSPTCRLFLSPNDSLVLTNSYIAVQVVGVQGSNYSVYDCFLKATFIPNIGARDSVVFIGPCNPTGTKFGTVQSKVPVLNRGTGTMKLYDLSGRHIDKMTVKKSSVYIATYGPQGALIKKLIIRD